MKRAWLVAAIALGFAAPALGQDVVQMISQYRAEHGLSTVKTDRELTAIAERQAQAMAASGIMDHSVAGSFTSRISGAHLGMAGENIAAGNKTWAETLRSWQNSPGHNANLLMANADSIGVAVARNEQTRYKTFWAMVIAQKRPESKLREASAKGKPPARHASAEPPENPLTAVKNFLCKYVC
jgi:Cysteine-rich secretory protein family